MDTQNEQKTTLLTMRQDNAVYGNGTPTHPAMEFTFEDTLRVMSRREWTPAEIKLVQECWDAYHQTIDNFDYQRREFGGRDVRSMCWAAGNVVGSVAALFRVLGLPNGDMFIPERVRDVHQRYQV